MAELKALFLAARTADRRARACIDHVWDYREPAEIEAFYDALAAARPGEQPDGSRVTRDFVRDERSGLPQPGTKIFFASSHGTAEMTIRRGYVSCGPVLGAEERKELNRAMLARFEARSA